MVDIVQHIWRTGEIPQELGWTILVLIKKGATKTQGIRMLETLWKVVDSLIDIRLHASLQKHDIIHRFRAGRGTGMAIMGLNLSQELASIDQDPLFLVLLDLRKVYGTVDRECLLITLEGYELGTRMCGLLETFWYCQQVLSRQNGFQGPAFPVTRSTMQGVLVSLTLFNMVVDNFIRTCLVITVEYQRVDHDRLGETVGRCLRVFYADD